MKDRVPANPGRVLITPENGDAPFYAVMTRADNPTQDGDPLCAETLLKVSTAALLGGDETMVPDDAFVALKNLISGITPGSLGAAKIETGSFAGTGSAVTLTFSFAPKMVVLEGYDHSDTTYFKNTLVVATNYSSSKRIGLRSQGVADSGPFFPTITFSGNTVSIATNTNITSSGFTFGYVAFG